MKKFFARLFGKSSIPSEKTTDQLRTAPLSEAQVNAILQSEQAQARPHYLEYAVAQSVGKQREINEDSVLALTMTIGGQNANLPFGLFVVADGMGGHQYGEVASNAALRTFAGVIMRKMHSYFFDLPTVMLDESLQEIMSGAILDAHRVVQREAPGGGTTLTAAVIIGQQITLAHVGDSRAYTIQSDKTMQVVSRDHTLVKRLEELGQITADDASHHPQRNVLYRAIGQHESFEPDVTNLPFPKNGTLMLCSDGLWGVVPEAEILTILNLSDSLHSAARALVQAANENGGPDNISVILARMHA
jgi:serine/threonine protein phosphatase PrpC